jgi:hypothetical protein
MTEQLLPNRPYPRDDDGKVACLDHKIESDPDPNIEVVLIDEDSLDCRRSNMRLPRPSRDLKSTK